MLKHIYTSRMLNVPNCYLLWYGFGGLHLMHIKCPFVLSHICKKDNEKKKWLFKKKPARLLDIYGMCARGVDKHEWPHEKWKWERSTEKKKLFAQGVRAARWSGDEKKTHTHKCKSLTDNKKTGMWCPAVVSRQMWQGYILFWHRILAFYLGWEALFFFMRVGFSLPGQSNDDKLCTHKYYTFAQPHHAHTTQVRSPAVSSETFVGGGNTETHIHTGCRADAQYREINPNFRHFFTSI